MSYIVTATSTTPASLLREGDVVVDCKLAKALYRVEYVSPTRDEHGEVATVLNRVGEPRRLSVGFSPDEQVILADDFEWANDESPYFVRLAA